MTVRKQAVALDSIVTLRGGGTPSKGVSDYWDGDIPWVSPKDMKTDHIGDSQDRITSDAIRGSAASLVPPGTLLIVVRSGILARTVPLAVTTKELAFNQDIKALVPSEKVDVEYLHYFLTSIEPELLARVSRGATVHRLPVDAIRDIRVSLPPISEQKRIVAVLASALEDVEKAIASAKASVNKAQELFDARLSAVFSGAPSGWSRARLSELMEISHGFAFKSRDFETSVDESRPIVLTPGNYTEDGTLAFTEKNTKRYLGSLPQEFLFSLGDLTIVMTDLSSKMKILGKPAFIDRENILHNQRIGRVRFTSGDISPQFVYYFLRSREAAQGVKKSATGTMVRHTAPKRILGLEMAMPTDRREQDKTVAMLTEFETQTSALRDIYRERLKRYEELRVSLLDAVLNRGVSGTDGSLPNEAVA